MEREHPEKKYVFPDLVFMEFMTAVALTVILLAWALLVNAPLLEMANPGISENPSKAPWYFVGLQELLVYFDPWMAGVMIPAVIIMCLMLIPYLDRNTQGVGRYTFSIRRFAVINYLFGFSMWIALILIGYFLRGPNWQLYWPWESWETIRQAEENTWNLPPLIGISGLAIYFCAGMIIPKLVRIKFYERHGFKRYVLVMLSILLMYFVPIKIFLRLAFDIRYVLVTPWFNV
ncbi:MAG: hypothetical protein HZA14_11780 [Nitrospirae bacterium]|nr:hypothetical protein [Nitrospirota bacterium]